jgi:hypothetical protein
MINVTLKDFGPEANWQSFDFGRSNQIETALLYQPKQAVLLRILLGHDFFIGKSRLWLAERAKYRGSHGGLPETGFKPLTQKLQTLHLDLNHKTLNHEASARNPKS